jgi:hypothetical protein
MTQDQYFLLKFLKIEEGDGTAIADVNQFKKMFLLK